MARWKQYNEAFFRPQPFEPGQPRSKPRFPDIIQDPAVKKIAEQTERIIATSEERGRRAFRQAVQPNGFDIAVGGACLGCAVGFREPALAVGGLTGIAIGKLIDAVKAASRYQIVEDPDDLREQIYLLDLSMRSKQS